MRVSTQTMNTTLLMQTMRVQGDYSAALIQQSSRKKSASLSGLSGKSGTAVSLQSDLESSARLVSQAKLAKSMVETAFGSVSSIEDILEAAKVNVTANINGTVSDVSTLAASAEGWLKEIEDLLNVNVGGTYVFGGNGCTSAPVDFSASDLYQGNDTDCVLMVDGRNGITYGITADSTAIQDIRTALNSLRTLTSGTADTKTLQDAYDLLDEAATALANKMETLSSQATKLNTLIDSQTEFQLYAESALSSITDVDLAEATATVAQHKTVLQASFSALSTLSSLSLFDYIK